jgi:hypothetical protein
MSIDQQIRPPLLTDGSRWRRAIFDSPSRMVIQRMDDSFSGYDSSINVNDKTLALAQDKNGKARFTFQRPVHDQLILDGEMDDHDIHMQLQLVDRNKFLLVSRGFHWIQESVFNR